jgi:hypothetical protein
MKLLADGAGHTFGSDMMKARKVGAKSELGPDAIGCVTQFFQERFGMSRRRRTQRSTRCSPAHT